MKLLFESWRQFLTEVSFASVEEKSLSDKHLYKYLKAARWDFNNNEQLRKLYGDYTPEAAKKGIETPTIKKAKETILKFIPQDIPEGYRGIALLWFIKRVLSSPPGEPEEFLRLSVFDGIWGTGLDPGNDARRLGIDHLQNIIGGLLETFFQHNQFMSERDINNIKTLEEFHDVVEAAGDDIQAYLENESYLNAEEGKQVIYEDDEWQIIIPINKGAACELGKGTDWCTASPGLEYYEEYHKPDDPLFIFVEKVESGNIEIQEGEAPELKLKAKPSGDKFAIALYNEGRELVKEFRTYFKKIITFDTESLASGTYHYVVKVSRYQFHFGSKQFMNQNDKSIEGNKELFYSLLALLKKAENVPAPIKEKIKNIDYQKLDNGGIFIGHLNGGKGWYLNNKLHRTDGPAYVWAHGAKGWYLNHMLHRTDGPAYVDADGRKFWYLNDDQLSKAEWEQEVQKMKGTELTEQRLIRIIKEELQNYQRHAQRELKEYGRRQRDAASCCLFNEEDKLLIIRRSETDPWRPGWWDLPGGIVDAGEGPMEAAVREADEETGIAVDNLVKVQVVAGRRLIRHYFTTKNWSGQVVFKRNPKSDFIEHDDYKWVTIEELSRIQNSIIPVYVVRKALNKAGN